MIKIKATEKWMGSEEVLLMNREFFQEAWMYWEETETFWKTVVLRKNFTLSGSE